MADPIHALVFSKDRAMQLDAFLRSAKTHAPYASIQVIACASTLEQIESYTPLIEAWQGLVWIGWQPNTMMEESVYRFLLNHDRVVFHTDDEVFYRTPPAGLLETDDAIITLRQGRNTTYCHPLDCGQKIPDTFPRWRWRDAEHDFAYPLSLNACIYHTEWLLPLLNFHFENPTQLEHGLACQHMTFPIEWMVAPDHSCTVALPHNRVSSSAGARAGSNPDWQPDRLADLFLDGWRIDLDAMDFTNIVGAHQEVPLVFRKEQ